MNEIMKVCFYFILVFIYTKRITLVKKRIARQSNANSQIGIRLCSIVASKQCVVQ